MSLKDKMDNADIKIKTSISYIMNDPESLMFCDKCKTKLGLWRMLRRAMFKKKGSKYLVVCKNCSTVNTRVKGAVGEQIDKRWDEYGV